MMEGNCLCFLIENSVAYMMRAAETVHLIKPPGMSVLEPNTFYNKHFVDSLWFIPYDAQSRWNGTRHAFDDHQQGKGSK